MESFAEKGYGQQTLGATRFQSRYKVLGSR